MKDLRRIQLAIAQVLRDSNQEHRLEKAAQLAHNPSPITALHLRSLDLTSTEVTAIAQCLHLQGESPISQLKSVSFSYNHQLGDSGATALANSLPTSISEVGLVGCGINDAGGIELLKWMWSAPNLAIICLEQNNFSPQLKQELQKFKAANNDVVVVY